MEIRNNREVFLLGDFNSRTGSQANNKIVGQFSEDKVIDNDLRLIHLCDTCPLRMNNKFFKHKNIHRYSWTPNTCNLRSTIEYIIGKQSSALEWDDVRVPREVICGSDHHLVRNKIILPFRRFYVSLSEICNLEEHELPI